MNSLLTIEINIYDYNQHDNKYIKIGDEKT